MTDARMLAAELARMPLLVGLDGSLPRRLADAGSEQAFSPGTILVEDKRLGSEAYVILDGTVRIDLADGQVFREGKGQLVGELALMDTNRRSASVTAETAVRALVLHGSAFHALLRDHPELERRIRSSRP